MSKEKVIKEKVNKEKDVKVGSGETKKVKKSSKKVKPCFSKFSTYIHKLFKQIHAEPKYNNKGAEMKFSMSHKAMAIMDSFVIDIFEKIANEASLLSKKCKRTILRVKDVQVACRVLLTGELSKHAIIQGMSAVNKYKTSLSQSEDRKGKKDKKAKKDKTVKKDKTDEDEQDDEIIQD